MPRTREFWPDASIARLQGSILQVRVVLSYLRVKLICTVRRYRVIEPAKGFTNIILVTRSHGFIPTVENLP